MAKAKQQTIEEPQLADVMPEQETPVPQPVTPAPRKQMSCSEVEELHDRLILSHEAADLALMQKARGDELTGAQVTLLRSVGLENPFEIQRHVDRLKGILRHQAIAGTATDRDSLADEVSQAEATRAEQLPAIRQELEDTVERLQTQIDALESAVSLPSKKLATMNAAVENLRNVRSLPQFIQDRYGILRNQAKTAFPALNAAIASIPTLEGRLELISQVPESGHIGDYNRHPAVGFLNQHKLWTDLLQGQVNMPAVRQFKAQLKTDLAHARKVVAEQGQEAEGRLAECEAARDYYVL